MKLVNLIGAAVFAVSVFASSANAGLITGNLNVDNAFQAYISTDDGVQGVLVDSGANWPVTDTFSYGLVDGVDYFIHIAAQDHGGIASFIGEFTLGSGHVFENGTDTLLTNATDWQVSTTGWSNYTNATVHGSNGSSPWGNIAGVDSSAQWIWSADAHGDNSVFFTAAIKAVDVPEPSTLAVFALVMGGLMLRRKAQFKIYVDL